MIRMTSSALLQRDAVEAKKECCCCCFFNPLKNSAAADFFIECGLTSLNLTCGLQHALSAICIITSGYISNE